MGRSHQRFEALRGLLILVSVAVAGTVTLLFLLSGTSAWAQTPGHPTLEEEQAQAEEAIPTDHVSDENILIHGLRGDTELGVYVLNDPTELQSIPHAVAGARLRLSNERDVHADPVDLELRAAVTDRGEPVVGANFDMIIPLMQPVGGVAAGLALDIDALRISPTATSAARACVGPGTVFRRIVEGTHRDLDRHDSSERIQASICGALPSLLMFLSPEDQTTVIDVMAGLGAQFAMDIGERTSLDASLALDWGVNGAVHAVIDGRAIFQLPAPDLHLELGVGINYETVSAPGAGSLSGVAGSLLLGGTGD